METVAHARVEPALVSLKTRSYNRAALVVETVLLFRHELVNGTSAVESLYELYCGEPALFSKSAPDSKLQPS